MYKSIINSDRKDPVFPQNYKQKEITHSNSVISNPSFKTGATFLSNSNLVDAKSVKSGCGFVALNDSTGCTDGRQTTVLGSNIQLDCDKNDNCKPVIYSNAHVPVDRPPQQPRPDNTNPDGLPVYNTDLNYSNYKDINIGDYVYYVDKDMATPYHLPNFTISGTTKKEYFTDPMGRTTLQFPNERKTESGMDISEYPDLRNEMIHRENQMASLAEINHKNEYTKAYFN